MTYLDKKNLELAVLRSTLAKIVAEKNREYRDFYEDDTIYSSGIEYPVFEAKMLTFDNAISILEKDIKDIESDIEESANLDTLYSD